MQNEIDTMPIKVILDMMNVQIIILWPITFSCWWTRVLTSLN